MTIYKRLNDHPLFFQLLEICARKEEKKWMEGKRTNLLTCELNVMKADGTKTSDVKDFSITFCSRSVNIHLIPSRRCSSPCTI